MDSSREIDKAFQALKPELERAIKTFTAKALNASENPSVRMCDLAELITRDREPSAWERTFYVLGRHFFLEATAADIVRLQAQHAAIKASLVPPPAAIDD